MNCKVQKYRVLVMGLLILSLMGLSGCGRQESTANVPKLKDPVGVDVDTAKVKKMNLSSVNSYSGEVVPDMVGAYFANSGQAGAVKVEVGDKVKKGQLLATLTGSESTVKDLQKELKSQIAENAETNTSSQSKIEQLNIELKSVQKQKKQGAKCERQEKSRQADCAETGRNQNGKITVEIAETDAETVHR